MGSAASSARPFLVACALPPLAISGVMLMLAGAGPGDAAAATGCGGAGTGGQVAGVTLDAEQMQNAKTIIDVTAGRHLPVYAGIVAIDIRNVISAPINPHQTPIPIPARQE